MSFEKNTVKSFRAVREDIEILRAKLNEIAQMQEEMSKAVAELGKPAKKKATKKKK